MLVANIPANMTRFYHPLIVNGSAESFIAKKFNGWYSDKFSEELQSGTTLKDISAKLWLSILKPLHAG